MFYYYTDEIEGLFEELVDSHEEIPSVLPSSPTVSMGTVTTAAVGMPTGSMSVDSTATVGVATVTMATDTMTVAEIAPGTTADADTTTVSTDVELCHKFLRNTCGCKKNGGKACSGLFSLDHYIALRAQASFLTRDELDLTLMGSMMSTLMTEEVAWSRHKPTKRSRLRQQYMHNGHTICRTTFMFLYGIGKKRLHNVKDAYNQNGLEVRIHKNKKLLSHNYLSIEVINNFKRFLINYCEENAILLPGRVPGYKRDDIKLLPSSRSKRVSTNLVCT